MLKGKIKPFDAELAEWSSRAEREIRRWLRDNGYNVVKHPGGTYGHDLEAANGVERFFVEVERRESNWISGPFSFSTIHVPERRIKAGIDFILFVTRKDIRAAMLVFPQSLKPETAEEVGNHYMAKDEWFLQVPVEQAMPVDLTTKLPASIAEENAKRVRSRIRQTKGRLGLNVLLRLLGGEPPYGMTDEEYSELWLEAEEEERAIRRCLHRNLIESPSPYRDRKRYVCRDCGVFYGYGRPEG